jgi:hypothetical protein
MPPQRHRLIRWGDHMCSVRASSRSGVASGSPLRSRICHTITDPVTAAAKMPATSHAVLEAWRADRSFRSARLKVSRTCIPSAALFNQIISAFPGSGCFRSAYWASENIQIITGIGSTDQTRPGSLPECGRLRPGLSACTRQKPRLSRELVLSTALALVDAEGLDALTMRRLGQELGRDR